ncbi:MAG: FG-GAP-like repeat-containing protein [Acidobacteriota bacterium]
MIRNLTFLLLGLSSIAPAQVVCPLIDFLNARELQMYGDGQLLSPLLRRDTETTYTLVPFAYSPPYQRKPDVPGAEQLFVGCLPAAKTVGSALAIQGRPLGKGSLGSAQIKDVGNGTKGGGWIGISGLSVDVFQTTPSGEVGAKTSYPVGEKEGILATDINGDRIPDLLVVGYEGTATENAANPGFVAFLAGRGDGTFLPAVKSLAGGKIANSAALGDFDRDGKLDVVTTHQSGLTFLRGKGDGTFETPVLIRADSVNNSLTTVGSADWNGDNIADLAVITGTFSGTVLVLLGNGNGTFRDSQTVTVAPNARDIAFGDFNRDGKNDLAVSGTNAVSVLLGNGDGTFSVARHWILGREPKTIVTLDLNGDGNLDIVAGEGWDQVLFPDTDTAYMSALLGNGDGTFIGAETTLLKAGGDISVADLNGDGRMDAVVSGGSTVSILLGSAAGFPAPVTVAGRDAVATGDFNGDGKVDFVTGDNNSFGMQLYLGNGNGTFQTGARFSLKSPAKRFVTGDFNGDSRTDVAAVYSAFRAADPAGVQLFLQRAGGGFDAGTENAAGQLPGDGVAADVNADGKLDVVAVDAGEFGNDAQPGGLRVLLGRGDGTFQASVPYAAGLHPSSISTGDVNGDGRPDFVVATSGPNFGNNIGLFLGRADGTLAPVVLITTDFGPNTTAIADFNGDGKKDIIVAHCCGDTDMTYLLGHGDGTFETEVHFAGGPSPGRFAVQNMNADQKPDLVLLNGFGGSASLTVLLNISPALGAFVNISGASFDLQAPVAPGSIVSAFGTNLAQTTAAAQVLPLTETLGGTGVKVRDSAGTERNAAVYAVSPGQVNYVMPDATQPGKATITIGSQSATAVVARVAPGIFQANASGLAAAQIVRVNGSQQTLEDVATVNASGQIVAKPIVFGPATEQMILLLYGTGLRNRSALANVSVTVSGYAFVPAYAGAQGGYPGLDQINVTLPRYLAGAGVANVVVSVDGIKARTVKLEFK